MKDSSPHPDALQPRAADSTAGADRAKDSLPNLDWEALERWIARQEPAGEISGGARRSTPAAADAQRGEAEEPAPFDPAETFYEVTPVRRFDPAVSAALRRIRAAEGDPPLAEASAPPTDAEKQPDNLPD